MSDVLVVGCGLLGTSIGLALRGSELSDVTMTDQSQDALEVAVERGAGRPWDGYERARIVIVAVPPRVTASELIAFQRRDLASTYTHVCSVQSQVQAEVESAIPDSLARARLVGGHPLAGREVSGPAGAVADLFVGRPWAVCPGPSSASDAVDDVVRLASACGAVPLQVGSHDHDAAVALLSHVPQVVSSALAGLLAELSGDGVADAGQADGCDGTDARRDGLLLELSGPGLVDMTRLAASNSALWTDILVTNARQVAPHLRALAQVLVDLSSTLEQGPAVPGQAGVGAGRAPAVAPAVAPGVPELVERFLERGNRGRDLVPVKRGEVAGSFAGVRVELDDRPGELARLLACAGSAGVNVEDLRVEHVPGRRTGVIELLVAPESVPALHRALTTAAWRMLSLPR